ncbi:ABC transporter ATP-binding protein [Streptomyces sp. NPDC058464]|uniref:ABC transporter ATP-binding protein n=1 Tax=Streptomyces sp. NPDC058464 TaxID=3346511 RepID=UPI0036672B82
MNQPRDGGLTCRNLVVERAGTTVVRGVSLIAAPGEVTVLLGANGAGKTTLLEGLSGLAPARAGTVLLAGRDLTRLSPGRRARAGLCHVQQGHPVFGGLTVEENLLVAAPSARVEEAYAFFPELAPLRQRSAGLLSGGEQQMLTIAQAILSRPQAVLLDEVSLGLAPAVVRRLLPRVRELADQGLAVLLVEQFAHLALPIGDRAYVLAKGTVVFEGACQELMSDDQVLHSAYLRT